MKPYLTVAIVAMMVTKVRNQRNHSNPLKFVFDFVLHSVQRKMAESDFFFLVVPVQTLALRELERAGLCNLLSRQVRYCSL